MIVKAQDFRPHRTMIPMKQGTNEVSLIVAQLPALRVSRLGHRDRELQHPEFLRVHGDQGAMVHRAEKRRRESPRSAEGPKDPAISSGTGDTS